MNNMISEMDNIGDSNKRTRVEVEDRNGCHGENYGSLANEPCRTSNPEESAALEHFLAGTSLKYS